MHACALRQLSKVSKVAGRVSLPWTASHPAGPRADSSKTTGELVRKYQERDKANRRARALFDSFECICTVLG